jgi:hypothetical protein
MLFSDHFFAAERAAGAALLPTAETSSMKNMLASEMSHYLV